MINKELLQEIEDYCKLNDLDTEKTLNKMIRGAFTTLKFGKAPQIVKKVESGLKEPKKVKKVKIEVPSVEDKVTKVTKKVKKDIYGE